MDDFDLDWYNGMNVGNYTELSDQATGDDFYFDLQDSLGIAFDGALPNWATSTSGGIYDFIPESFGTSAWSGAVSDYSAASMARQGLADVNEVPSNGTFIDGVMDKLKGTSEWIEKNKKVSELIAGGIGGAVAAREGRKAVESKLANEMALMERKRQMDLEDAARKSASITGLQTPTGLLYSGPLKRRNGSQVFNGQGQIAGA